MDSEINPNSPEINLDNLLYIFVSMEDGCDILLARDREEALMIASRSNDQETMKEYQHFIEQAEKSVGDTIYIDDGLALGCRSAPVNLHFEFENIY
jgi:hypothetical protein